MTLINAAKANILEYKGHPLRFNHFECCTKKRNLMEYYEGDLAVCILYGKRNKVQHHHQTAE